MDGDEYDDLVADIRANGLIEPVWYDRDGFLLDGRNRVRACGDAGVRIESRTYEGDDPIGFVLSLNLQRRHLTVGQRAMVATDVLPMYEEEAERRRVAARSANLRNEQTTTVDDRSARSDEKAASSTGISGRSVSQAKRVRQHDIEHGTDIADQVRTGTLALDAAEKQVKRRQAQIAEQEAREVTIETVLSADAEGDRWRMLHGDFRERLADLPDGSVDLIVTDPPYPAEFLPLYSDLSKHAARVLTGQGIVACLTGQIFLPEVLARLGENLKYGWIYVQPLPRPELDDPGPTHQPNLETVGRVLERHMAVPRRIGWHPDTLDPSVRAKGQYRWQQDGTPAQHLIVELCPEGGTVCDPFTGTGAYGGATMAEGRRFIGIEADQERFDATVRRFTDG